MNINDLTIFRTVVQTGSFSKAATALNYTQSNISMKIQSLETLYSTTFFIADIVEYSLHRKENNFTS